MTYSKTSLSIKILDKTMQLLCPENFYKPHAFNETMKEIPLPCEVYSFIISNRIKAIEVVFFCFFNTNNKLAINTFLYPRQGHFGSFYSLILCLKLSREVIFLFCLVVALIAVILCRFMFHVGAI